MRDDDDRFSVIPRHRQQELEHEHAGFGIERAGRLVAEKQLGIFGERTGDGYALLLAARQLGGEVVQMVGQPTSVSIFFASKALGAMALTSATFSYTVSVGIRL